MKHVRHLCLLTMLSLVGCSIHQSVEPAFVEDGSEMCVIRNERVRLSFHEAIVRALDSHGLKPRTTDTGEGCPFSLTYNAIWSWDLALYLRHTSLTLYRDGKQVGSAIYDATDGSGTFDKFINADAKVQELVAAMLAGEPRGAADPNH